jgi:hypothetical protein
MLGVTSAAMVPSLVGRHGNSPSIEERIARRASHIYDAFELAKVGVDMRILAYVIIGVGILGVIAGLGILKGSTRLAVPGTVAASIIALMLTMAVVASIAFAQMLGLAWIPASLSWGVGTGYSFPPALVALVAATVLMLGGAFLTPTYSKSRR